MTDGETAERNRLPSPFPKGGDGQRKATLMTDQKKIAAIAAAVNAYLEEEAQATAMARRPAEGAANLWQASGRMEMMQMRSMWQRRILPRR